MGRKNLLKAESLTMDSLIRMVDIICQAKAAKPAGAGSRRATQPWRHCLAIDRRGISYFLRIDCREMANPAFMKSASMTSYTALSASGSILIAATSSSLPNSRNRVTIDRIWLLIAGGAPE
jgi:hypothetical protein